MLIDDKAQSGNDREKFKETARDLECDDDEALFKERLGKLVKHKPVEKAE